MYTQEAKYYPDYTLKSFKECYGEKILNHTEYNINGDVIYRKHGNLITNSYYNDKYQLIKEELGNSIITYFEYYPSGRIKLAKTILSNGKEIIRDFDDCDRNITIIY